MKVISVIENRNVIKKILKHLGLWELKSRPPPMKEKTSGIGVKTTIDYSLSQLPPSEDYLYFDMEYPVEDPELSREVSS